ncbi:MAG: DUF192 domain-containing protein [Candidatus Omnitrophica bacterium]|nr:DUF192 domain-containing protein [Candidatus Omnitrophota bacterium]
MRYRYLTPFIIICCLLYGCRLGQVGAGQKVCLRGQCFAVEIADTPAKWIRGLQERQNMPLDQGMLFVFPKSEPHIFWMKDTLIPLDMIWMDDSRRVIYIEKNAPPCLAEPCATFGSAYNNSLYVLELNSGQAEKIGLRPGEVLDFKF